jgi:L-ascorbate metabolism protein UlaG (beta-lactamase superfamily)
MGISEILVDFDAIEVGFDINKAEDKAEILMKAFNILEDMPMEENEINEVLKRVVGLTYEIGGTKQWLPSKRDSILVDKALAITKKLYKDERIKLLPYLRIALSYSEFNSEKHRSIESKIDCIENEYSVLNNPKLKLIPAIKKDEALITEMDSLLNEPGFNLWWLGQSGYLLQWKGKRILIDPYLSDSLTKKYSTTDKPHTRISESVIQPELLKNISVVTSSHNHTDHLDAETLTPVLKNNPGIKFITPEANRNFVAEKVKCDINFPIGLNDKQAVTIDEFTFHGIPARHNEIDRDEKGNCKYMGYIIEFGKYKIYHSGDTLWFDEMVDLLKPFNVDVAILPINGNKPERKVAGNLDCKEAAMLGKVISAKVVIPCHYDLFEFNTADVNEFVREAEKINQPYCVLKGGEYFSSNS